ncbi:MAG: type VI secretion system tip protein VgrG [Myxococcales bacterium]|nr:type VI secretion system tip protein VgrG [Myxococcales bacterium]
MAVTVNINEGDVDVTTLTSLEVTRRINRIPEAVLHFYDGHDEETDEITYALSNLEHFAPGAEVSISITRTDDEGAEDEQPLFIGKVFRHAVEAEGDRKGLRVELKDIAIDMTGGRRCVVHREQSDAQIITALIGDAGLEAGTIPDTKPVHAEILQYLCSDWDFMLMRAEIQGLLVSVDDGTISLYAAGVAADGALTHEYVFPHDDIYELELEFDGSQQNAAYEVAVWNPKDKKRADPVAASADPTPTQGQQSGSEVGEALGLAAYTLEAGLALDPDEATAWVNARQARSRMAMIRGRMRVKGVAPVTLLDQLSLDGVGARFDGTALITGITQRYDDDEWSTEFELGLESEIFARTPDIVEPAAAGLLPPIAGLQLGVVKDYKKDELGEHRIQVVLPMVPDSYGPIWARLATPDAGPARGFLSWPEPGDEVVVAFLNQDPRQAVILGSTFSSVNAPPALVGPPPEDKAKAKRIMTTLAGLTILFDEERPGLTLQTKAGNKIDLDDTSGSEAIVITDKTGNSITMNKDGVTIKCEGKLTISASGDVAVTGSSVDFGPS